ncbi:hypothetical protein A4A49_07227 [Nicotiana attenuata]|uniref:DUF4283 domain-containing protein n=1 Tax=Nicotiana attenuata TaxID=49451 RepID=A0A314KWX2_NICAT|nr:hypothetical protein A4A49_07227 [Nicotiana attenuata]
MAEEITQRLHKFILTEEEKEAVAIEFPDIQASMKECEISLLSKVISDKKVNFHGIRSAMTLAWGNPRGLQVKEITWNFFQFIFKEKTSLDKVKLGTPWLYDRYLLNIYPWEPGLESDSPIFNESNMWVQVWNIPLHWMSKDVGRKTGHVLGCILDILIPENGSKEEGTRCTIRKSLKRPVRDMATSKENASFLASQKRQDFNNNREGYRNYKLVQEKRTTGTKENLQHLEDEGDSMDMQDGVEKENVQVEDNGLQGKEVLDLQAKGDDNLNAKEAVRWNQDKAIDDAHNGVRVSDVVSGNAAVTLEEPNMLIDILIREEFGIMGRRRRNLIKGIENGSGEWICDKNGMVEEIEKFYRELFTTSNPSSLSHVLQSIPTSIDENMNLGLISKVTNEEIKEAIFSMHPNKSPVAKEHVNTMCDASTNPPILTLSSEKVLLYVDAGLDPKTRKASIGMVALQANGDVLYAYGSPIPFVGKAIIAEAWAIRTAIQLAVKYVWKNIYILSDSLTMVQMLNESRGPSWEVNTLCEDILDTSATS